MATKTLFVIGPSIPNLSRRYDGIPETDEYPDNVLPTLLRPVDLRRKLQ